ncbi:hypothetical protein [Krasilnikovia sp. MM14-A1259]|uniref:hypothetical protein n=1 Tax=Krasilnikovia sp. MM14-A1259 TaxID=3373539 RepID=UPI00382EC2F7
MHDDVSVTAYPADVFTPLRGGERPLWRGRAAVAEYAFEQVASLPRWALPEPTEVLVTDQRLRYAYASSDSPDDLEVTSGELRWQWPRHLRVQPGAPGTGRAGSASQLQLVCAGPDGTWPALVLAGGDLRTVRDADRLANVVRQAVARFRIDNAQKLGLSTPQARMLSRLLIGPEFRNHDGGEGQTVSLHGALPVSSPGSPIPVPRPGPDASGERDDGPGSAVNPAGSRPASEAARRAARIAANSGAWSSRRSGPRRAVPG